MNHNDELTKLRRHYEYMACIEFLMRFTDIEPAFSWMSIAGFLDKKPRAMSVSALGSNLHQYAEEPAYGVVVECCDDPYTLPLRYCEAVIAEIERGTSIDVALKAPRHGRYDSFGNRRY